MAWFAHLAEYCYNTSLHSALNTTPFRVVYGRDPPHLLSYEPGMSKLDAVDEALRDRDAFLQTIRQHLQLAQARMTKVYNHTHRDVTYIVGQWVWLRIHPYRQLSGNRSLFHKLLPKYFGPFHITKRIGDVAYQLALPFGSRLQDVFHISLLKEFRGTPLDTVHALPLVHDGRILLRPAEVLRTRMNHGVKEILVRWSGGAAEETSWENLENFQSLFPNFKLGDKLDELGGVLIHLQGSIT